MYFEDNLDVSFDSIDSPSRTDIPSLYDTNSRDSGFEDLSAEALISDDSFLEEFAEISFAENHHQLPTDFSNLIQGPIVTVTVEEKPSLQRVLSTEEIVSPLRKKICQRPENIEGGEGYFLKRRKRVVRKSRTEEFSTVSLNSNLPRAFRSEEDIKSAIQRSYSEPDLIADFSKSYSLPLAPSRHQDLKAINSNTLKQLLDGEFNDRVGSFKIIDCRYPYEYNGGHIKNAINIYSHEQCSAILEESSSQISQKPEILIFHCEFSSERGPNLYRHLRQEDRRRNVQLYPSLCFPEIYILEGGYKHFFEANSSMCHPASYTQMLDPRHSQDLAYFRQFSKTWDSDVKYTSKKQMKNKNIRKFVL